MGRIIHGPKDSAGKRKVKPTESPTIIQEKEYVPTVIEMEKIVKVEVVKYVDKPIYIDKPIEVFVDREVIKEVPTIQYVDKIVEVEKRVPYRVDWEVEKIVNVVEKIKYIPMWMYLLIGLESVTILGVLVKGLYG